MTQERKAKLPRWAVPLMQPARYKGARGGRASGKSWFFAQYIIARMLTDVNLQVVCIREIQRSLKFSAKKLLEDTIRRMGVGGEFEVLQTEIRRRGGPGIIIFQGMQDHTADSIKSLESFDVAWCEEAQSLSHRSMELLIPTIRQDDSELLFSWNPEKETNAVERLFDERDDGVVVHVNYTDNPWCPQSMKDEAARMRRLDPERFNHIWKGGFNKVSDALVFRNKYSVRDFEPGRDWNGPYYGLDFGFSNSPTAGVKCWIYDSRLWIEYDMEKTRLELDATADSVKQHLPGVENHTIRADSARPESISYLKRHGLPRIEGVKKGKGSVEDGIQFIRSFEEVVIHSRCQNTERAFGSYSHKVDKLSGDILPVVIQEDDHIPDALRYALEPIMKKSGYTLDNL